MCPTIHAQEASKKKGREARDAIGDQDSRVRSGPKAGTMTPNLGQWPGPRSPVMVNERDKDLRTSKRVDKKQKKITKNSFFFFKPTPLECCNFSLSKFLVQGGKQRIGLLQLPLQGPLERMKYCLPTRNAVRLFILLLSGA